MILFKEPQPLNKYSRLSQKDENAIAALPKRSVPTATVTSTRPVRQGSRIELDGRVAIDVLDRTC